MRYAALLIATLAITEGAAPAIAQSVQKGEADSQESPPPGVFQPFDRFRGRAADTGVTLAVRYTSELGYNPAGGDADRVTETGQADLDAKLDLGKIAGLNGGTLNAVVTWRRGRLLDQVADLGTLQQTQEVFGRGQTWRLTRLWYEQSLGRASLKLGRSNVGEDFATFSCDFMNLTFCGAQPGNIVGDYWLNWPVSQWMARAKLTVGNKYVQVGAYEVNPRNLRKTFTIGYFNGATGVLIPLEAVWKARLGGLPGLYRLGAWYDTSRADDAVLDRNSDLAIITGIDPLERAGRSGAWVMLRQQVAGAADMNGTTHGLTLFFRATRADRRTARLDSQMTLGVFYEGLHLIASDDALGVAVGATHVNSRVSGAERVADLPAQGREYVGEIFYSFHPFSGVVARPNLQYVIDPGGQRERGRVVVLGIKTAFTL